MWSGNDDDVCVCVCGGGSVMERAGLSYEVHGVVQSAYRSRFTVCLGGWKLPWSVLY